ncbi:MAG: T9SS type A sorting domain-containing protein [Sphingobacteriales bacterium]|nr:MAG: T9SS type A sorting domain-containing protein [Sphingobacteriales bacterium]
MHKTTTQHLRTWMLRASLLVLPASYVLLSSNSSGISGQSTAGCNCHGSNTVGTLLTITGIPTSGWVPGQAYSLFATVASGSRTGAGFDISVTAGTLSNPGAGATLASTTEIRHNARKAMASGSASWTFTWTAPTNGATVSFNFAGNAVNSDGTSNGDNPNQTTLTYNAIARPTATTNAATGITTATATLNGTANASGNSGVTASFEYGTSTALGSSTAASPATISGTTATAVTGSLSGLQAGTMYYYRLKLSSTLGSDTGAILSFTTTSNAPVFGINTATAVTTSTATVNGRITPNTTSTTTFGVKYGTTTALSQNATTTPASGSGTSAIAVSANLSGLSSNRKYYYAFTATMGGTTRTSATDSFTTQALSVAMVAPVQIGVYPNPAQQTLEGVLPAGTNVLSVQAFTLSGQRLLLPFVRTNTAIKADVSTLASGMYYLYIRTGDSDYAASFQKN